MLLITVIKTFITASICYQTKRLIQNAILIQHNHCVHREQRCMFWLCIIGTLRKIHWNKLQILYKNINTQKPFHICLIPLKLPVCASTIPWKHTGAMEIENYPAFTLIIRSEILKLNVFQTSRFSQTNTY